MKHIKQFPHCDPRVLHAPGECNACDKFPVFQELREYWQIAFTGQTPGPLAEPSWSSKGPVLQCPADYIRGDRHAIWGGNRASKPEGPPNHVVKEGEQPASKVMSMVLEESDDGVNWTPVKEFTMTPIPYSPVACGTSHLFVGSTKQCLCGKITSGTFWLK